MKRNDTNNDTNSVTPKQEFRSAVSLILGKLRGLRNSLNAKPDVKSDKLVIEIDQVIQLVIQLCEDILKYCSKTADQSKLTKQKLDKATSQLRFSRWMSAGNLIKTIFDLIKKMFDL